MGDPFELVRLRCGAWGIRSLEFGEICHPGVGPAAEAQALYVEGLALPTRWLSHRGPFVVWDIGLGGAANAMAVMNAAPWFAGERHVVSFDRTLAQLEFALRHSSELGYFGNLVEPARELLQSSEVTFQNGNASVRWTRVLGDFPTLMQSRMSEGWPKPHAILFDPHSPAVNPLMWTLAMFRSVRTRLDPQQPCSLATYSRSTTVRATLLLAGFFVGTGSGTATKEETTVAASHRELIETPLRADWLGRARRSRAAEPWVDPPFGGRPLRGATYEQLRRHPQFAE